VRRLVARDLGHQAVNLQTLATQLGMPPRTLQRYLADEGSSVREIVRDVRIQQAKSLLETGRRNIGTVSRAIGYSDPTAFWRAFKSREGMAPGAFREQAQKKGRRNHVPVGVRPPRASCRTRPASCFALYATPDSPNPRLA
jgi:AraC-like DNA-binding protein